VKTRVTIYYLEMTAPDQLLPSRHAGDSADLIQARIPSPELNRFLYTAVGGDWYWVDRLTWTYQQWLAWLDRPEQETWVLYVEGTPAGYFELDQQAAGNVEIAYFGLLPRFVGRGFGGYLLTQTIRRAWQIEGARRVWVHTCSLDHPNALAAYQARGLRLYDEQTAWVDLPAKPPGPWPGAHHTSAAQ